MKSGRTLLRVAVVGAVGMFSVATVMGGGLTPRPADAAASVGGLTFSSDMNDKFEPTGQVGVEFDGSNNGVAVTFQYTDFPGGGGLGRIVRWNGEDYNWDSNLFGKLNCCNAGSGRYGFWVVKRKDGDRGDLPGGAYDVRLYLNGNEIQHAGFGIKGEGGGESDNQNGNN